eukprot:COSAG01_NODE_2011_length_8656_cov_4.852402_5_plen_72_part_00
MCVGGEGGHLHKRISYDPAGSLEAPRLSKRRGKVHVEQEDKQKNWRCGVRHFRRTYAERTIAGIRQYARTV